MTRATPRMRNFAERLISIGATQAATSASETPAVFSVFEVLRPSMVQVVGVLGFSAVLSRALAMAKTDSAWLRATHVEPDGRWGGLDKLQTTADASDILESSTVLLAEFVGLLVDLIGERLVLQLVRQAMPDVARDDLYFGEGNDREKS